MVRGLLRTALLLFLFLSMRVVSLSPSLSEDIKVLGGYEFVVGDVFQSEVRGNGVEVVGSYVSPSVERVAALSPDLVIYSEGTDPRVIKKLREMGLKVRGFEERSLEEILKTGGELVSLLGLGRRGKEKLKEYERALKEMRKRGMRRKKFTFCFIIYWSKREIWVAGRETFISEGMELMGGVNVLSRKGWGRVSREFLMANSPDFVVVAAGRGEESRVAKEVRELVPDSEVLVVGQEFNVPSLRVISRFESLERRMGYNSLEEGS